jgi:hypothetical protein
VTSTRPASLSASEPRTADLKVERNSIQARARIAEAEAMPQRNAAKVLGLGGDSEHTIRLLIALMVLRCDPLAIALTAAASARQSTAFSRAIGALEAPKLLIPMAGQSYAQPRHSPEAARLSFPKPHTAGFESNS